MNCAHLSRVLDAEIDGELDHATSVEIAEHLAECAACTSMRDGRLALRQTLRMHAPYFKAPVALSPAISRAVARSRTSAEPQPRATAFRSRPSWLSAAALATVAALAGLIGGYWLAQSKLDHPRPGPAVASHVAALAPTRQLIQIASSDRHTVKPWFQGKVDFAPPVKDLGSEGFALMGGRLDQVADQPAAAVVYQVRKHVINLFVWRAVERASDPPTTSGERGFSVVTWAADGLRFAAVSDVDARDLTRFAKLVSAP